MNNDTTSLKSGNFKKYLKLFGHFGALLTVTAWGLSFIATKVLMLDGGMTPVEVYVYRFAMAYCLLLLFTFKKIRSNSWRDELNFLLCGVCSGSLYFITENFALQNTTTGNVSLLASVSPIFTTILVAIVYKIHVKAGVILGSIVAFIGVGCIIFSHGEGFEIKPLGDLLALSASLSWAIYTIVVKRLIPLYSTFFITRKMFFYGVVTALPLLFMQKGEYHLHLLFTEPHILLNMLFLVLFCSLFAYIIWNEAMKILGSVTANNYIYMQPLVTMVAGVFVLGEHITLLGYLGCFLIIFGLIASDKLDELRERYLSRK